jgi:hypothetical protein
MKTIIALFFISITLAVAQDAKALDEVIRKRDALLVEILDAKKQSLLAGGSLEAWHTATVNLYVFRRDAAKTPADRISWQEKIVAFEKKEAADMRTREKAGVAQAMDVTIAEERALAAEQKLLELQLAK